MFQVVHGFCFPYTFWPSLLFKSMFGVSLVLIVFGTILHPCVLLRENSMDFTQKNRLKF